MAVKIFGSGFVISAMAIVRRRNHEAYNVMLRPAGAAANRRLALAGSSLHGTRFEREAPQNQQQYWWLYGLPSKQNPFGAEKMF
ncbi:hypothetical protein [Neisseria dentiae]|uniref:hypothetical protein n=1 Tax=Neisseria dentiae TaxID=194197 RepID=UPI0035A06541